jgi:hypothetical protein
LEKNYNLYQNFEIEKRAKLNKKLKILQMALKKTLDFAKTAIIIF